MAFIQLHQHGFILLLRMFYYLYLHLLPATTTTPQQLIDYISLLSRNIQISEAPNLGGIESSGSSSR